jgi:hypothetical protein
MQDSKKRLYAESGIFLDANTAVGDEKEIAASGRFVENNLIGREPAFPFLLYQSLDDSRIDVLEDDVACEFLSDGRFFPASFGCGTPGGLLMNACGFRGTGRFFHGND